MNKLRLLKRAIAVLFLILAVLLASATLYESEALTIACLLIFTAVAALITYYMVLKQL